MAFLVALIIHFCLLNICVVVKPAEIGITVVIDHTPDTKSSGYKSDVSFDSKF